MKINRPTDPGGKAYYDYKKNPKSVLQKTKGGEMPAADFSLKDALSKIKSDMTTQYIDETSRLKKTAEVLIPGFTEGFSGELAKLTKEAQSYILSALYSVGTTKLASLLGNSSVGSPPPTPIPQAPIKQQFNLGSQVNMLGKTLPPDPTGQPLGQASKPMQNPLTDMLPKSQIRMGIPQLKYMGK